jgi:hypothetical protein
MFPSGTWPSARVLHALSHALVPCLRVRVRVTVCPGQSTCALSGRGGLYLASRRNLGIAVCDVRHHSKLATFGMGVMTTFAPAAAATAGGPGSGTSLPGSARSTASGGSAASSQRGTPSGTRSARAVAAAGAELIAGAGLVQGSEAGGGGAGGRLEVNSADLDAVDRLMAARSVY